MFSGYNDFREFCGMPRACSFSSSPPEIRQDLWSHLSLFYDSPSDVDLFTAGLMEEPHDEGLVGRTFSCIIARQFQALKFGDRFFFTFQDESSNRPGYLQDKKGPLRFTSEQIEHLMKRGLGGVICDNTDIVEVREQDFRADSKFVRCQEKRNRLDLNLLLANVY